ncbi:MAG: bifunctional sugar-1-phosphate nucleotidylyltransferase/acetyltransferase [Promethearchaeota archaeon]|jgi:bifunctional UDP-N-acetylglucosamine pyrophosphorylase/glucosamine-1-phosphate N-acetyltransferase
MKAVILVAGKGLRLMPITSSRPKPMIPLAGKPILEHLILGLKEAGIREILLIVGYKEGMIIEYFNNKKEKLNIKIEYITQRERLGTGHAASLAKDFVEDEPFLLMYGDLMIDPIIFKEIIEFYNQSKTEGLISLLVVDNPQDFGIISLSSDGYVKNITEKPSPDLSLGNLANAGIYIFNPVIFEAIEKTEKSIRGEYEFTDSMQIMINQLKGKIIGYNLKDNFWSDIGLPWQLLDANNYFLEKIKTQNLGEVEQNVHISGNVYIGEGTKINSGSYIQGPCYIGNNNVIGPDTIITPYTFISNDCHIIRSEIKNSIILSKSFLPESNYIVDTILCENVHLGIDTKVTNSRFDNKTVKVTIKGQLVDSRRKKLGAVIGPNVKIGKNVSIMAGKIIHENSIIGDNIIVREDITPNTF